MPFNEIKDLSVRLCMLTALALGTACGDDLTATTDGSTGGSTSDETNPSTTTVADTTTSETTAVDGSSSGDMSTTSTGNDESTTMVDPTEATSSSSSSSGEESSSSSSSSGGMMAMECPYGDLTAPDLVSANTSGQDSEFTNTCGGGGAPDVSYTLTAPADGTYFFTATSPNGVVDPLIAIYDGVCGGPEIACNEDIDGSTTAARTSVALTAGDTVTVVLDGFSLAGGPIDLEVTFFAGACPDGDLGNTVPAMASGDSTATDNTTFATCGGSTANDDQYTFTAPEDGVYVFDTAGSDFDTVLYLLDSCGGTELACNDDVLSDQTSHISIPMSAGDDVVAVVDGANLEEGNYVLTVDRDECPDVVLNNTLPVFFEGSTSGELDASQGSCGGFGASDASFSFTAPEAGIYTIDTAGSDFDTVIYGINGCGGSVTTCNDDAGGMTSRINITLAAGEETFFVVDGADGASGNYDVNIELDQCPDFELMGPLPIQSPGSTAGEVNSSTGSCGGGGAPDVAYTFTAPVAGTYIFDTEGSGFDTLIYAFDGETCAGTSLACNDDAIGLQSRIVTVLAEGQTITVVVDGFSANSGDYILNVTSPVCGNDTIEFGEACDGAQLDGETCATQGFSGGTLACDPMTCQFDASDCDTCGNGTVEGSDMCDGVALGSQNCQDLGFDGGALDCAGDCSYDTAQCANGIVAVCSTPGTAIDSLLPAATDTITVPDIGTIADVDVFVDITHTFDGDLEMSITADGPGVTTDLSFDLCGSSNDVFATFNDEGSSAVGANCAEPIGIEGNLTPQEALTAFDGMASNGTWTLTVNDDAGGDVGTLNEWCVYITLE